MSHAEMILRRFGVSGRVRDEQCWTECRVNLTFFVWTGHHRLEPMIILRGQREVFRKFWVITHDPPYIGVCRRIDVAPEVGQT